VVCVSMTCELFLHSSSAPSPRQYISTPTYILSFWVVVRVRILKDMETAMNTRVHHD
jgi:hypothetical protein